MDNGVGHPLQRIKGLADDMLPGLGQHLNGHIIRNHVPLDQRPQELILRVGSRRETHLDLLKTDIHQHLKKFQLLFQAHGLDQGLVAVPQIHAAPHRRLLYNVPAHPVVGDFRGHKIRSAVFFRYIHVIFPRLSQEFRISLGHMLFPGSTYPGNHKKSLQNIHPNIS